MPKRSFISRAMRRIAMEVGIEIPTRLLTRSVARARPFGLTVTDARNGTPVRMLVGAVPVSLYYPAREHLNPGIVLDMARGSYEPDVEREMQRVKIQPTIFVDIGAHFGYSAALAMNYFPNLRAAVLVEPNEDITENIQFLMAGAPIPSVHVPKVFAHSDQGTVDFYVSQGAQIAGSSIHPGWTADTIKKIYSTTNLGDLLEAVNATTEDHFFFLVDIEGAESEFLEQLIHAHRAGRISSFTAIVECSAEGLKSLLTKGKAMSYLRTKFYVAQCHPPFRGRTLNSVRFRQNIVITPWEPHAQRARH